MVTAQIAIRFEGSDANEARIAFEDWWSNKAGNSLEKYLAGDGISAQVKFVGSLITVRTGE